MSPVKSDVGSPQTPKLLRGGDKICVLVTCFNRREMTLAAIEAVKASTARPDCLRIFLTDDGSTDGTGEAVRAAHPDVTIVTGDGNLFWNGGMLAAWEAADRDADFFVWLNDDLEVHPGALDYLLQTYFEAAEEDPRVIVAGKIRSRDGTSDTYGGRVRAGSLSRIRFRPMRDDETLCDTFNGNFALIPALAAIEIGMNDPVYSHSMGDMDYGLRARKAGWRIIQTPHPVGFQDANPISYSRPLDTSWVALKRFMTHPKGTPVKEWLHFTRRHAGTFWWLNFIAMYAKPATISLFYSLLLKQNSVRK